MENFDPALYVVATPIGNMGDISLRAIALLKCAEMIACEDTRHSRLLFNHYGIHPPQLIALHEHNEHSASVRLIEAIKAGQRAALITDAGTPGIADPGARACAAVRAAGLSIIPLPGANAAIAALSAAGLPDEPFLFVGFLPNKAVARQSEIKRLANIPAALVFYEAPHRIAATLADFAALLAPSRTLVIAREITKLFEQIAVINVAEGPAWLAQEEYRCKGEFVLIVTAAPSEEIDGAIDAEHERILHLLMSELPAGRAARLTALITGAAKNRLYQRALQLTSSHTDSGTDQK